MKKSSIVWNFFDRVEYKGRCTSVICRLCESEYKFFGNTTNLRVHLGSKHPIQWELARDPAVIYGEESNGESSKNPLIVYQVKSNISNNNQRLSYNKIFKFYKVIKLYCIVGKGVTFSIYITVK